MKKLKIQIPDVFIEAFTILRLFETKITEDKAKEIYFRIFSNCREKGIVLNNLSINKMVLFIMNSRSSDLTIYYGLLSQFDNMIKLPVSDEVWDQLKSINYKNYKDVTAFMKKWLFSKDTQLSYPDF